MPPTQPSAKTRLESSRVRPVRTLPKWFAPLFYLLLAFIFLWRSTLTAQVFLPAGLLGHIAPYSAAPHPDYLPAWNPLRWDGIAQFYPWRHFAANTLHSGFLPLWNPYQFCGTPFVANSQSAPFYPGNLLFYIMPTARAFGYSAALHLALCGWFMYLLLRRLRCGEASALLGGIVFAYSAWQVNWLQLPTFLATSCWFPLLLRQIHIAFGSRNLAIPANFTSKTGLLPSLGSLLSTAGIGAVTGMMILAGHLQITFYGLLAGTLWTLALLFTRLRERNGQVDRASAGRTTGLQGLLRCLSGLALGLMLAAPQLLPTLELSRQSHRVGNPSAQGYAAYTEYALPAADLTMLALPEFFGNDSDPTSPYWGFYTKRLSDDQTLAIRHNAAETGLYVGLLPLLLTLFAIVRLLTTKTARDRRVVFMTALGLIALMLALGTPLNALFYFGIPGFGQSGSPARCLVLWAMACASLSAFGLDALLSQPPAKREVGIIVGIGALFAAICLSLTAHSLQTQLPGFDTLKVPTLAEAFGRIGMGWLRLAIIGGGSLALLLIASRSKAAPSPLLPEAPEPKGSFRLEVPADQHKKSISWLPVSALGIVILDLFVTGIRVNLTADQSEVYPVTPGIAYLQQHAGHSRIMPLNRRWSLLKAPPAVLPPNGATVYGLRDVQGYDSLLTGQYKAFANQFSLPAPDGSRDASPPEVGNMVFFQNPEAALLPTLGAEYALTTSNASPQSTTSFIPRTSPVYEVTNEMGIYPLDNALPRAYVQFLDQNNIKRIPAVFLTDTATRVVLRTDAPTAGTLHLADQQYPGWMAFVDGQPLTFLPQEAQFGSVFRSVAVPTGAHTVEFRFQPFSFLLGCYAAFLGVGLLTAIAVLMLALRRGIVKKSRI